MMTTGPFEVERLHTALRELVSQENVIVRLNELDELPEVQNRIAAVQAKLITVAGPHLTRPDYAPMLEIRAQSLHILMERSREARAAMVELQRSRGRLKAMVPAYGESRQQPGRTGFNAAA
jgi:hypothetical protein